MIGTCLMNIPLQLVVVASVVVVEVGCCGGLRRRQRKGTVVIRHMMSGSSNLPCSTTGVSCLQVCWVFELGRYILICWLLG